MVLLYPYLLDFDGSSIVEAALAPARWAYLHAQAAPEHDRRIARTQLRSGV